MTKTKYQQTGTDEAMKYLEKLLEMEDSVNRKMDSIARQKTRRMAKSGRGFDKERDDGSSDEAPQ